MPSVNHSTPAKRILGVAMAAAMAGLFAVPAHAADNFVKPTPEELSMTSMPGYPGVPAVVLFREQTTVDDNHVVKHYERIKILTEEGKKYADIELPFSSMSSDGEFASEDKTIGEISGRTIHPDGTIVPFTGKPYLKMIAKTKDYKVQERVFSLPDVTVGSIIEYRYNTRFSDYVYEAPDWYIQGDLYVKAAHYVWNPTNHEMTDAEEHAPVNMISWYPILPPGVEVKKTETPGGSNGPARTFEVTVKDVPPKLKEDYMPPIGSFSYRVLFNFTPFRSGEEYWKSKGNHWSKRADSFMGPNGDLKSATGAIIASANTQDEKLRKIYAAVMALENTSFTRTHDRQEDKVAGLSKVNNASAVLSNKRGSSLELTELFVGMARAAGMKAYLMLVPDRSEDMFSPAWLNFGQFDNAIAIVNVDGKEQYFDPGQRYCAYGHLAWENTLGQGIRQTDSGTDFVITPIDDYKTNKTTRIGDVGIDEQGNLHGKIVVSFYGAPALRWRHVALRGDSEATEHSLTEMLQKMVPNTMEVKVKQIEALTDYEKPLVVTYDVKGTLGTPTGKRVMLPADLFVNGSSAAFPHEKRELAVYFSYPQTVQDAVRVSFPASLSLEATPQPLKSQFEDVGAYNMSVASTPTSVTVQRSYLFNAVLIKKDKYADLRSFYSKFEAKDQESVVLKAAPAQTATASPGSN